MLIVVAYETLRFKQMHKLRLICMLKRTSLQVIDQYCNFEPMTEMGPSDITLTNSTIKQVEMQQKSYTIGKLKCSQNESKWTTFGSYSRKKIRHPIERCIGVTGEDHS